MACDASEGAVVVVNVHVCCCLGRFRFDDLRCWESVHFSAVLHVVLVTVRFEVPQQVW